MGGCFAPQSLPGCHQPPASRMFHLKPPDIKHHRAAHTKFPMLAPTAVSGDAIQAGINVSVAQSRRLVSSWLPPPTPEEIASQKTDEQLAKEDAELFTPTPPR